MGSCPCWSDEHHDRGDGVMVCGRCGVAKCQFCDGEGEIMVLNAPERCGVCGGDGEHRDASAEALAARSVAAENARLRQQLHIARNALTQATPAACQDALRHIHDLEAGG